MAKRRTSKWQRPHRPLNTVAALGGHSLEEGPNGALYKVVRTTAKKRYMCPGCNGVITVGEQNVMAWTEDTIWGAQAGIDSRRHWHRSCWEHRGRRK
ncbi:ATP/GTP-binding protein [Actinobaculum suis]|uniref:hypothetical protein n=1 Tax=Actinobaculum suis TaxID=1657 RepID=UPI00066FC484|nr:hypothetical protein [Actinobaculum suis]KMY22541.1 ATP/GTP-binding protein [Actinobaculum suis]